MSNTGTLSIVATPIGNLEDITLRALRVLKEADLVLCEDTRVTSKLLIHYDIAKKLIRFDAHAERTSTEHVLDMLAKGKKVVLVSDAGTPAISDPGAYLVHAIRTAIHTRALDACIEVIPGPSSLTAALSLAGIVTDEFVYKGFLPHKKGRQTALKEIAQTEHTVVLFESPHRILKLLTELAEYIPVERTVSVAKELTKIHEAVYQGSAASVQASIEADKSDRGEFVVIIHALHD
jgi:16S rRNA (cytidine1402-2'-O)-methyltransferase